MEVTRIRALRGPNLWSRHTAIEAVVTCTSEERDLHASTAFQQRLRQLFPAAGALHGRIPNEPISMANALELTALALQAEAGCPVSFSRTTPTPEAGTYQVAVQYTEEAVGRRALQRALELCQAAAGEGSFDAVAVLEELRELDEDERLGPSTESIARAALARSIPVRRLTRGSLLQLGWGSRQRRVQAAEADTTSAIAEAIAQDKNLTKELLRAAGVPVPRGQPVDTPDEGWSVACALGLPVVVKPRDANQGKGVTAGVHEREQFDRAFEFAAQHGPVMVEELLPGHDFRLLVVGGKLVAAARRDPPLVIGDGERSVRALVEEVNSDPRRGKGHGTPLTRIRLDDIAEARLAQQGLTPESVPAHGQRVVLRNGANLSTGGSATDVSDSVHPEVAARAVEAAHMVGLDICGVDVVCESVMEPLEQQKAGVVEVNAAPGLRMHLEPSFGKSHPVGRAIVDHLMAEGDDGRIPIVAVTGTNGKTTTVRLVAHLLQAHGLRVGMTNSDGVYVDGLQIDSGDCSGPQSARRVLAHPDADAAVLETARGGILREGLGFDRCEVGIVTNLGQGDHLGLNYITTVEDLMVLKQVVVENVASSGTAVLNAADPHVAAMAPHCPGRVIFFATDPENPVLATHRAQGKPVVFVRDGELVCVEGRTEQRVALDAIKLTHNGSIDFQVQNAMAAVAAAWALGVRWPAICEGLATFDSSVQTAPGRFNVFRYRDATVIADYGHNPDAIAALVSAVEEMPARQRTVVISGAGDRRDQDIELQTQMLGRVFDTAILYQDACQRGRVDGEVLALLRQGLQGATRTRQVEEIHGEMIAIDHALAGLQPGDLCLILIDQVQEALAHIQRRIDESLGQRPPATPRAARGKRTLPAVRAPRKRGGETPRRATA